MLTVVALQAAVLLERIDMRPPEAFSLYLIQPKAPDGEPRQKQKTQRLSACDYRTLTFVALWRALSCRSLVFRFNRLWLIRSPGGWAAFHDVGLHHLLD